MGVMLYGSPPSELTMDDRMLAHLKIVVVSKLRRNESFLLSWELPAEDGPGRMSLWMHPSIPLQFKFDETRRPPLNGDWLEEMARASMGVDGLRIPLEPHGPSEPPTDTGSISIRTP
jgi:hypothetical protein